MLLNYTAQNLSQYTRHANNFCGTKKEFVFHFFIFSSSLNVSFILTHSQVLFPHLYILDDDRIWKEKLICSHFSFRASLPVPFWDLLTSHVSESIATRRLSSSRPEMATSQRQHGEYKNHIEANMSPVQRHCGCDSGKTFMGLQT